ncbi:hypothetical protein JM93_01519 [Roseibium hamelinense]|uniref:Uncharacterized protein n=1 Tax=Roseibium hamelinense TaxID=150831 RepID=A0A562TBU1_9HYPH|nr:hypothetical protein [Roseibium hamelinense]MTI45105.1 hypothetical protein [Roseibium hamelinense]TWI90536.1 hypothetical protein JM93_01519 [Roseibium hamelinense]
MIPASHGLLDTQGLTAFSYVTKVLAGISGIYLLAMAGSWSSILDTEGGQTHHTRPGPSVAVQLQATRLSIPVPLMSAGDQARLQGKGSQGRRATTVTLNARWPDMAPIDSAPLGSDGKTAKDSWIEITLAPLGKQETIRDRLFPVYAQLAQSPHQRGPAGLREYILTPPGSSARDGVVFEPGQNGSYAARCTQRSSSYISVCTRNFRTPDGLFVSYRFDRALINSWGRLERKVNQLVASLTHDNT